jgi:Na+-driven multidrug efflux pump
MTLSKNISNKKLLKEFLALALPTVLSGLLYTLYTIIDGIFIGRYLGAQALAALNLLVPLLYLPYAASLMVGVGGATLVARLMGEGKTREARRVFTQSLALLALLSAAMTAAVQLFLPQIVSAVGATGIVAVHVADYLGTAAWFSLFASLLYALEFFLRAEGARAARLGLYAMALGALVNVGLDYWLIVILKQGMAAPALATGISMSASSLCMLAYHVFRARSVRFCRGAFQRPFYLGRAMYNGASEFLGAIAPAVVVFAFNRVILRAYGDSGLAAYAILEYTTLAAHVVMIGLVQSMQPMVSFHRGAGDMRAVRASLALGASGLALVSLAAALAVWGFAAPLAQLFLPDSPRAWQILGYAVPWYAPSFPLAACNLIVAGYFTALERPGPSALIAVLRSWVLLFAALWCLTAWLGDGAVWFTLIVTEAATLAVSAYLLWRSPPPRIDKAVAQEYASIGRQAQTRLRSP